jgi:hypothetical protein
LHEAPAGGSPPRRPAAVAPVDAAWELLDGAVEPYQDDLDRLAGIGLDDPARATCEGVLLGPYRLRDVQDHDVLPYAEGSLAETVEFVPKRWLNAQGPARRRRPIDAALFAGQIPEQGRLVDRVKGRIA